MKMKDNSAKRMEKKLIRGMKIKSLQMKRNEESEKKG